MESIVRRIRSFQNIALISSCLSAAFLILTCDAGRPDKALLNESEFRDKVYACWLGKNIGGTLGMPFEGRREPNDVTFYTNVKSGEPAANDDLDLQILWLKAMQDHQGKVEARILADYWLKYVPVDWNEYGVCKVNLKRGILPPLSGEFDNAQWKNSNGAWIRSEIWACLAPGCPGLAARMAREDACVDHGSAEGTYAEIFTASLESAAFVEQDRDKLIAYGLSMIPEDCRVARAVARAVRSKREGKDWKAAREDVIGETGDTGWFQAPRNVAFMIIGWLYGDNDFGKSICIAINCGDDTDCTGATLGSIFGIIGGTKVIPDRWRAPVGDGIRTVAIAGIPVPANLHELTDSTVAMSKRVLRMNAAPVMISGEPTAVKDADGLLSEGRKTVRSLWTLSPYQIVWTEDGGRITLDYAGDPVLKPGEERKVRLTVENLTGRERDIRFRRDGLPEGWHCAAPRPEMQRLPKRGKAVFELALSAPEPGVTDPPISLTVFSAADSVEIPMFFLCYDAERNGLRYQYYEGDWDRIPDFDGNPPKKSGKTAGFDLQAIRMREDHWAIRFEGAIRIAGEGAYTFWLTSDDGSRLWVDGKRVVENDGAHAPVEKRGEIFLTRGLHRIYVDYFEYNLGESLKLEYAGPGFRRREVPRSAFLTGT